MVSRYLSISLFVVCALLSGYNSTFAEAPNKVRVLKECKSWKVIDNGDGSISAVSFPVKQTGTFSKREQPYVTITKFADQENREVSFYFGYTVQRGSESPLTVYFNSKDCSNTKDGKKCERSYYLLTHNQNSWAKSENDDKAIINDFKIGSKTKIKANSTRNTYSEDEYSLAGFADCYKLIAN